MAATPGDTRGRRSGRLAANVSLPGLPVEVLEEVCHTLELRDRISLASCCRELWAREDVAASAALWSNLEASFGMGPQESGDAPESIAYILSGDDEDEDEGEAETDGSGSWEAERVQQLEAQRQRSLAAWLARRGRGLRRLELHFGRHTSAKLAFLLGALGGSALAELHLCFSAGGHFRRGGAGADGSDVDTSLDLLQHAKALTCLTLPWAGLRCLSPSLSALSNLRELDVSFNAALGRGGAAALRPLHQLASLTRLDLSECRLQHLPPGLSALSLLRDLNLRSVALGGGSETSLPLQRLRELTYLGLNNCSLARLPPALSALGGTLAELDLNWNESLGLEGLGEDSLAVLQHLTALTSLGAARCSLRRLPQGLSALSALVNLNLNGNIVLGAGAFGEPFEPLRHLCSLTSLWIYECGLTSLPPQLTALSRLAQLSVASNEGLGWEGEGGWAAALAPLQRLSCLTRLSMAWCSLRRLPPALTALASLASLDGAHNDFWGAEALAPARSLPALTRLDVRGCGLAPHSPALAGFSGRCCVLALGEYRLDEALS